MVGPFLPIPPPDFRGRGTARSAVEGFFGRSKAPPPCYAWSPSPAIAGEESRRSKQAGCLYGLDREFDTRALSRLHAMPPETLADLRAGKGTLFAELSDWLLLRQRRAAVHHSDRDGSSGARGEPPGHNGAPARLARRLAGFKMAPLHARPCRSPWQRISANLDRVAGRGPLRDRGPVGVSEQSALSSRRSVRCLGGTSGFMAEYLDILGNLFTVVLGALRGMADRLVCRAAAGARKAQARAHIKQSRASEPDARIEGTRRPYAPPSLVGSARYTLARLIPSWRAISTGRTS
jgi:hypothetical protein